MRNLALNDRIIMIKFCLIVQKSTVHYSDRPFRYHRHFWKLLGLIELTILQSQIQILSLFWVVKLWITSEVIYAIPLKYIQLAWMLIWESNTLFIICGWFFIKLVGPLPVWLIKSSFETQSICYYFHWLYNYIDKIITQTYSPKHTLIDQFLHCIDHGKLCSTKKMYLQSYSKEIKDLTEQIAPCYH